LTITCNLANQHRKRYCNSVFYWEHVAVAVNSKHISIVGGGIKD
jgi:hypothetical protein